MVSDNRESSLISSIKSTLNNISHSFIINSLRRQGNNQRGVLGWGAGVGGWGEGGGGGVTPCREQSRPLFKSVNVGF